MRLKRAAGMLGCAEHTAGCAHMQLLRLLLALDKVRHHAMLVKDVHGTEQLHVSLDVLHALGVQGAALLERAQPARVDG